MEPYLQLPEYTAPIALHELLLCVSFPRTLLPKCELYSWTPTSPAHLLKPVIFWEWQVVDECWKVPLMWARRGRVWRKRTCTLMASKSAFLQEKGCSCGFWWYMPRTAEQIWEKEEWYGSAFSPSERSVVLFLLVPLFYGRNLLISIYKYVDYWSWFFIELWSLFFSVFWKAF